MAKDKFKVPHDYDINLEKTKIQGTADKGLYKPRGGTQGT